MPVVRVAVAGDEDEARVLYYSCHTQYKLDLVIEGMGENERKRLILVVFCFAYLSVSLQSCSVIGVETKDTWPGTVTKLRMVWIPIVFLQFYLVPIFPRNVFFFFKSFFSPLISVLQLPQEWSHFPGLQGAQKGERAALLHLRESWSHGPWLRSRQWAEVLLLRWVWPHPEAVR